MIKPNPSVKLTDERVSLAARVYPDVAEQINSVAKEYNLSVSDVLRWSMNDLLDKLRPQTTGRN